MVIHGLTNETHTKEQWQVIGDAILDVWESSYICCEEDLRKNIRVYLEESFKN
jgi:hypothetical protein